MATLFNLSDINQWQMQNGFKQRGIGPTKPKPQFLCLSTYGDKPLHKPKVTKLFIDAKMHCNIESIMKQVVRDQFNWLKLGYG